MAAPAPRKPRQRGVRGAGSIYKDSRGYWRATLPGGVGADGKRRRVTVTSRDRGELLRRLEEARMNARGVPTVNARTTVSAWLQVWRDEILPGTVKPGTAKTYADYCRLWIEPWIGWVPLGELGPEHLTRMQNELEGSGLGAGTRRQVRTVLSSALGRAERWGKITRNPTRLTDRPRKTPRRDEMSADEANAVLAAAAGDRLEGLAVVLLFLGLRPGEALGLRWSAIDLGAPQPTLEVVASKSDAGRRVLPLPGKVAAALRAHRRRQAEERLTATYWHDPGLVFTNDAGAAIAYRRFGDWWRALVTRAGVTYRRPYSARHTAATLMLNNGVPLEVVSAVLGHANLSITADVYAHVGAVLKRGAADVMDSVLG